MSNYFRQYASVSSGFNNGSWVVLSPIEQNIKAKIEKKGILLKDWDINIYRGLLTGCNEAFIIDNTTKDKLIQSSPNSAEIIRPILLGRNIKRYSYEWENIWLINSHNGIKSKGIPPINVPKEYPAIFEYLNQFKAELEKRLDKGDHWTNLRNCAYLEDFGKPKIAWGNLALKSQFSYIPSNYIINAPSPFFVTDNLYLLAILNSSLGDYYIKQLGVSRSGGYVEYKPMFVEKLPIPKISQDKQLQFAKLVETLMERNKHGIDTTSVENEINEKVFRLYELTNDEISTVKLQLINTI